jgi:hypothetical protein
MVERTGWTSEAISQGCAWRHGVVRGFLVECLDEDAVKPADIDEVIVECAAAGGIEPFPGVLLAQRYGLLLRSW